MYTCNVNLAEENKIKFKKKSNQEQLTDDHGTESLKTKDLATNHLQVNCLQIEKTKFSFPNNFNSLNRMSCRKKKSGKQTDGSMLTVVFR